MRTVCTCINGHEWSARITIEYDVNATIIHDDDANCPDCGSDNFEISGDSEPDEPEYDHTAPYY